MTYATRKWQVRLVLCLSLLGLGLLTGWGAQAVAQDSPALKLIYSDWPGWVTWEIAKQKDFFALEGVAVELLWMDYVAGMEAFAAGQADAVCMTNGDALVTGAASGKPSTAIILNDYSNGNDMVVGRPGIESISDLKGLRVGVEVGFVGHLLLLTALEAHGMTEHDVTLVNIPTNELPQALAAGSVDAITAWQPNSGQALKVVPGSKRLYSSADSPGIIYDLLYVSHESLAARRDDWAKVVRVWYRIVAFMQDPANRAEMLEILFPVVLGGDHSLGYPTTRAVAEHLGGGNLGIIHFDRHVDTQDTDLDERMHTTPWFHATNLPNVPPKNLVQIGIGGWQAPRAGVQVSRERGTTIMTVTDCVEMGIEKAAERALEVAWDGTDAVWLSFDIDCLDAAFVPGTGWPEPGGFLPREVLKFIHLIAAEGFAGMEVVECAPPYDNAEITSLMACRVICDTLGCLVRAGHLPKAGAA